MTPDSPMKTAVFKTAVSKKTAVYKKTVYEVAKRGGLSMLILLLGSVLLAFAREEVAPVDVQRALDEGNRHFRNGQFEEAIGAYLSGYSPEDPHPTLVYNLGTTYHRLSQLPEAILWYQRSDNEDPWRQENLWLARRTLGSQELEPGGLLGRLFPYTSGLRVAAIALSWLVLLVLTALPKWPRRIPVTAAALAFTLFTAGLIVEQWAPRPAVLLQDCLSSAGELPAGTEAWVRPRGDGAWAISGTDGLICDRETAELIFPAS